MRKYMAVAVVVVSVIAGGCKKAAGPGGGDVAARVNGREILRAEVEKHFQIRTREVPQKPTELEANFLKLEILRGLVESEIVSQKAEELKLLPTDSEVDADFQKLRGAAPAEEFQKQLQERGLSEADLRQEVRRNLAVRKLMENQVQSKVQVSDAEVSRFFEENQDIFNIKEQQFRIGQIVVSPDPSVPVSNLRNDKALNEDQALRKIEMLTGRLQAGDDFGQLAREYSEDPQTAQAGGDLGFQPVSALDRYSPTLKQTLMKMKVGDIAPVIRSADGYWILKLLGMREPGQRNLSDPEVKEGIREELRNQKQQLLTSVFVEQLHNEARVENFLARDLLAEFQKGQ